MKISLWPAACAGVMCFCMAGPPGGSYLVVETPRRDMTAAERGAERFPDGAQLWLVATNGRHQIAKDYFAAADPQVSFDAKRVLFTGRESATARWQIYEAELGNGAVKRLSTCNSDCIRPVYLPGAIAYARRTPSGFQVERLNNGTALRLTYAPGNWLPSAVLEDGRILLDGPHANGRDIYTLYSDGSGIETVRCDHRGPRRNARQAANGDIVFETTKGAGRFTSASAVALAATAANPGDGRVPVIARPVPKRHPSALGNRGGANLLSLNVYTSKLNIPEGSVARVRVISEAGVLGEAPVESDGSWYAHVPSEKALRFELLDKTGKLVAKESGWMWMRRGEQRICVGCHAGPERTPENAVPQVLVHNPKPVELAGGRR